MEDNQGGSPPVSPQSLDMNDSASSSILASASKTRNTKQKLAKMMEDFAVFEDNMKDGTRV